MTNVYQLASNGTVIPKEITGTVTRVETTGHTVYGNPIKRIYLEATAVDGTDHSGIYRISDNAALVYGVENAEYRDAEHVFTLTRAGRISHAKRLDTAPVLA